MSEGGGTGFHLRLTAAAYAGWKTIADDQGMTTSGLLEMVGRHLAAVEPVDAEAGPDASAGGRGLRLHRAG